MTASDDFLAGADDAELRAAAARLAAELAEQRLEVVLIPAPTPRHPLHQVRVATTRNPEWYRRLCEVRTSRAHPNRGRHDTAIKRQHTLTGLHAIAAGRTGPYYDLLLPLVRAAIDNV